MLAVGACGSTRTSTGATATVAGTVAAVVPQGFGSIAVTITQPDGTICRRCMLLADTEAKRARGLMGVTSLGGYDGMVFRYDTPVHTAFWMKDTVTPLQIAFFDPAGRYLRQFDMPPCTHDPCATYGPTEKFTVAIETFAGTMTTVGVVPASTIVLGAPCPLGGTNP